MPSGDKLDLCGCLLRMPMTFQVDAYTGQARPAVTAALVADI